MKAEIDDFLDIYILNFSEIDWLSRCKAFFIVL